MATTQELPFKLFDELYDAMSAAGSLYLGPDFRGRYMVRTLPDGGNVRQRYTFELLRKALLAAGYTEATDAEDFDSSFYVASVGWWTSGSQMLLVPHEQVECLDFAAMYIAEELDTYNYTDTEEFSDYERAEAKKVWDGLLTSDRRSTSKRVLGKQITSWKSAMEHDNYQDLIEDLLTD